MFKKWLEVTLSRVQELEENKKRIRKSRELTPYEISMYKDLILINTRLYRQCQTLIGVSQKGFADEVKTINKCSAGD